MTQLIVTVSTLYKRKAIPTSLPDKSSVVGTVYKGFTFQGTFIPSAPGQVTGGWYKDLNGNYYWGGGVSVRGVSPDAPKVPVLQATVLGIDVSSYQEEAFNWPMVKNSISFVYVKATEGFFTIDRLCNAHATWAKSGGLKIGYYHFGIVSKDAVQQARHFDTVIKTMPIADLMPVLDVETNKANLTPTEMEAWITTFITTMNSLGHQKIMIYSYTPFLNQYLPSSHSLGKFPLWIAQYNSRIASPQLPKGWDSFTIWQYDDDGSVQGTTNKLDMNKAIIGFA